MSLGMSLLILLQTAACIIPRFTPFTGDYYLCSSSPLSKACVQFHQKYLTPFQQHTGSSLLENLKSLALNLALILLNVLSFSSAEIKKQRNQEFYQQNEFIWEQPRITICDKQTTENHRHVQRIEERGLLLQRKGGNWRALWGVSLAAGIGRLVVAGSEEIILPSGVCKLW